MVLDFGYLSSITIWFTFKFSRLKVCAVVKYDHFEKEAREGKIFWNDSDRFVDRVIG